MRIAVIGVGAMGSVYAGLLADGGHDVLAIDAWAEHVEAIRSSGLRVEGASGDRVVRIEAATTAEGFAPVDLVVIATKSFHVAGAAMSALALCTPETLVLPIQNGLGSNDVVAEIVGDERVLAGVAGGFGASMVAPGHAHHHGLELIRLGERHGPVSSRVERVAEAWRQAGFAVKTFDDVQRLIWDKLVCNCAFSGPCGVVGGTIGDVLADPSLSAVSAACATEAFEVGVAAGVSFSYDDPVVETRRFGTNLAGARPSVLLDLLARRPTEIAVINGAIPRVAAGLGREAPVNALVTALVEGKSGVTDGSG
jgi:2-dehydropantoate 2-reductase